MTVPTGVTDWLVLFSRVTDWFFLRESDPLPQVSKPWNSWRFQISAWLLRPSDNYAWIVCPRAAAALLIEHDGGGPNCALGKRSDVIQAFIEFYAPTSFFKKTTVDILESRGHLFFFYFYHDHIKLHTF